MLLHGFPELTYSWRKVMPSLAAAGFHAIRARSPRPWTHDRLERTPTTPARIPFRLLNMTREAIGLIYAPGYCSAAAPMVHDASTRRALGPLLFNLESSMEGFLRKNSSVYSRSTRISSRISCTWSK